MKIVENLEVFLSFVFSLCKKICQNFDLSCSAYLFFFFTLKKNNANQLFFSIKNEISITWKLENFLSI